MFAWQSLQEEQCCSDLLSAHACVCAPHSGEVNSWLSHRDSSDPFPLLCALWCAFGVDSVPGAGLAAESFPIPVPAAFFSLRSSFFFAPLLLFSGSWLCVSCLYFRRLLLLSLKAFNVDLVKIKPQQRYWFWPLGSFHFHCQPDVLGH